MATIEPKSRLMITKMILENFKSYAGIEEIGPFHKRFSSIVGPNGSGKSNVIDALLFVFAKRASQLRLKKVSELIHKSSGFPNLEYAQVSVHFQLIIDNDSEDDFDIVPNSEFVISRIAYQNNQSKYMINNKSSTSTDVKNLLDTYGIDLDNNRFLILQGEVEQIAMMKPKAAGPNEDGLLEYLEDIIGSNRYVEPIEEASKALEAVNEQRIERVNRLKFAEKERDCLSGSRTEAENYLEKEREIRRKQNVLYQIFRKIANDEMQQFQSRLDKANEKLNKERSKLKENECKLSELDAQYKIVHKDYDEVAAELQESSMVFSSYERRDVKLQEDLKHNENQLKKAQATLQKESKKETESSSESKNSVGQIESLRKQLDEIVGKKTEEQSKIDEIMANLQEATKSLRDKLEVAQLQLAESERGTAGLLSEKEVVLTRIQLLKSRTETATASIAAIQKKLEKLQEDKNLSKSRLDSCEKERISVEGTLKELEAHYSALTEHETALQVKIRQQMTEVEEVKARIAMQKMNTGSNNVITAIMKASSSRGPLANAGVHGRLGDLGTIDDEFDVAISTACGMLDYIVVETTEGAQACLNFLRENNVGRASFLLMDQIQEWKRHMQTPFRAPSGTHRLFDLIAPKNEAYLPAFYMALKDTLVANDLDAATAIAYVGDRTVHRIVTRTGELIDTSGAMSGGGKEVRSGGMKLKSNKSSSKSVESQRGEDDCSADRVAALESQLSHLQTDLNQCRQQQDDVQSQMKQKKDRLKVLKTESEKDRMVLSSLADQESELTSRLQSLSSETSLNAEETNEIRGLERKIAELESEMDRVSPNLRQFKLEVSSIQQQIRDVGGPRLSKAQARLDLLSTQFEKIQKDLTGLEVDEENNRKQALKARGNKDKAQKEVDKFQQKVNELLQEQQDMEQDAMNVIQAVEAAKTKMAAKENELAAMKTRFEAMKSVVDKIKTVEVDLEAEADKASKEVADQKKQADQWNMKLEILRKEHFQEQSDYRGSVESVVSTIAQQSETAANISQAILNESIGSRDLEELVVLSEETLVSAMNEIDEVKKDINILEAQKEKMRSSVNMNALLDFLKKDAQYRIRVAELEMITEERNKLRSQYEELRRKRLEEFMNGFAVISLKLKEMYQMITLGGDAELELVDSLDPFSEGIVFTVRPKNKSWKNISNLSGGEKTLSSLALVFALHHYKPTPLYVMDEIDAALDFKNVSIVANYIKDRTKDAQFIIISLRNNMFELADRLVGIYKTHDATKSVTINPKIISAEVMSGSRGDGMIEDDEIDKQATQGKPPLRRVLSDATNIK